MKPQVVTARASYSVQLRADRPELVLAVAEIRWKESGHAPEPEDLAYWVDVTQRVEQIIDADRGSAIRE